MNKKIYLNIYQDEKRLKKYRLDIGKYLIGNKKDDADIYLDEENLGNGLKIIVDSDYKIFMNLTEKNKKILINNSKFSEEKIEIKTNDQITFKNSDMSLKIKFEEIKRERSRSKEDIKIVTKNNNHLQKEKTEPESEQPKNNSYIKSQVIWNSVQFENEKRTEKFLKLMGAKKKSQTDSTAKLDTKETEKLQQTFDKIQSDLTKQYYNALGRNAPK